MLVIGQCNRTVKGTVNMSCLCKWTERVTCAHAVVSHFAELTVVFFFYEKVDLLSSFFHKFCHNFD